MNVEDPAVRNAVRMANAAAEAREQFCAAFLAQTGLMPDQATMCYGKRMVGNDMVFQVWFEPNELRMELKGLRDLAVSVAKGEADPAKARELLLLYGGNQAVTGIEPPADKVGAAQAIFERLESYGFQCDGGDLANCQDWKALKQLATMPLIVAGDYSQEELDKLKQQLSETSTAARIVVESDQPVVIDKIETLEEYRELEKTALQFNCKLLTAFLSLFELEELAPFRVGKFARVGRVSFTHADHIRDKLHDDLANNNILLVNSWIKPDQATIEYMLAGEQFELCAPGQIVPEYECTIIKDEEAECCQFSFARRSSV